MKKLHKLQGKHFPELLHLFLLFNFSNSSSNFCILSVKSCIVLNRIFVVARLISFLSSIVGIIYIYRDLLFSLVLSGTAPNKEVLKNLRFVQLRSLFKTVISVFIDVTNSFKYSYSPIKCCNAPCVVTAVLQ